ncbi:MAG: AbrB/MazE/SpoVT family DNA-binding domain-containing protein [Alphaproteobacteria bacterium]|nr:AbrB/MazE/SpoVT family DNA-binding domain-containing protein [Alphaproteobacteria bacterium]
MTGDTKPDTAKLFMHGRSQAVRLPKAYRMPGTEVRVRRDGEMVILEPIAAPPVDWTVLWARIDAIGADFPEPGDDDLAPPRDIDFDE